jgi:hypothetical protein
MATNPYGWTSTQTQPTTPTPPKTASPTPDAGTAYKPLGNSATAAASQQGSTGPIQPQTGAQDFSFDNRYVPNQPDYGAPIWNQAPKSTINLDTMYGKYLNPASFATDDQRRQMSSFLENTGQIMQMRVEKEQQGIANQQWSAEYNRQLGNDEYNRYNTDRNMTLQERTAQEAANQAWQSLGLQEQKQNAEIAIAQEQNSIDQAYKAGLISNEARAQKTAELRQQADAIYQQGELAIAGKQAQIEQAYKQGLISNEARAQQTAALAQQAQALFQQQQIGVANREAATAAQKVSNEFALGREANRIDAYQAVNEKWLNEAQVQIDNAYKQGLISNEARAQQTAALKQQADALYQRGQLGVANREQDTAARAVEVERQLGAEQNRIDNAYKQGLISNEQRAQATDALRQKADALYQQGQLSNVREENRIESYRAVNEKWLNEAQVQIDNNYKQGLISNEQRAQETARLAQIAEQAFQTGTLTNTAYANTTDRTKVQNDYQVAIAANAIEKAYKEGQITLGQRAQALQELQNSQQFGIDVREIGLKESTQAQDEAFRRAQLAQQRQLETARQQNELLQTRYQAFGRGRAPATFARNWAV